MAASLHIAGIRKAFGKATTNRQGLEAHRHRGCAWRVPASWLGPSGCGKSTLLNIIAGPRRRPARATCAVGRTSVVGVAPAQRDIAMVFQSYALYPTMIGGRQHRLRAWNRQVPEAARRAHAEEVAADAADIAHLLDRRPAQLSSGSASAWPWGVALAARPAALVRRAAVQPGRQAAGGDARRDQAPAPAQRHHQRVRRRTTRSRP